MRPSLPTAAAIRHALVCAFCLAAWSARTGLSEDRVTVIPPGASSPFTINGTIIDYNGEQIVIRLRGAAPQYYPASAVVEVETYYQTKHRQALEAYAAGEIEPASKLFEQALKKESRSWVKREIRAGLVRCATRSDQLAEAINHFLKIAEDDDLTRHWSIAPLVWAPLAINANLRAEGRRWMVSQQSAARLHGASLLLMDAVYGESAERELNHLASDPHPRVAALARTQLWRLRLAEGEVGAPERERWERTIADLPSELRAGPQYLRGRADFLRGAYRDAAAELLWLPLVYQQLEPLAARACLEAAESLQRAGLQDEARSLYEETALRYHWSTFAAEARQHLRTQS